MRKFFIWAFAILALVALVAVCLGAKHQLFMAVICGSLAFVLIDEELSDGVHEG